MGQTLVLHCQRLAFAADIHAETAIHQNLMCQHRIAVSACMSAANASRWQCSTRDLHDGSLQSIPQVISLLVKCLPCLVALQTWEHFPNAKAGMRHAVPAVRHAVPAVRHAVPAAILYMHSACKDLSALTVELKWYQLAQIIQTWSHMVAAVFA